MLPCGLTASLVVEESRAERLLPSCGVAETPPVVPPPASEYTNPGCGVDGLIPLLFTSMAFVIAAPAAPAPLTKSTRSSPLPASVNTMFPEASTPTPCASLVLLFTFATVNRQPSPKASVAVPPPAQEAPFAGAVAVVLATEYT